MYVLFLSVLTEFVKQCFLSLTIYCKLPMTHHDVLAYSGGNNLFPCFHLELNCHTWLWRWCNCFIACNCWPHECCETSIYHPSTHHFPAYPLFIVIHVKFTPLKLSHLCYFPAFVLPPLFVVSFEAVGRGFAVYGKRLYRCNCYVWRHEAKTTVHTSC